MRQLFLALLLCSVAFAGFAQCLNTAAVPAYGELIAPATTNGTTTMNSMRTAEYPAVNGVVISYQYKMTTPMFLLEI